MRILVGMMHPKHVYMFKNFMYAMIERGHTVGIIAIEKDLTEALLTGFQLQHEIIGKNPSSTVGKMKAIPQWTYQTYKIAKIFNPDIFIGQAFPPFAYLSALFQKPYIIFEDTESAHAVQAITFPFSSTIVTPSCYREYIGKKQVHFNGYYELAYLHPNHFTPDPTIITELGLAKDEPFIVVRFVSWEAIHDVGQHGIRDKFGLVKELERYGRVIITSEGALPPELEEYRMRVSPEKLHDLLYYAMLYVGEGGTMASEAAVLGTHAIYVNTIRLGYTDEEEEKYELVYTFSDPLTMEKGVYEKALELLGDPYLRAKGKMKRERLLNDKIDVTAFMIWFIENYPQSFNDMKDRYEIKYSHASTSGDES